MLSYPVINQVYDLALYLMVSDPRKRGPSFGLYPEQSLLVWATDLCLNRQDKCYLLKR